MRTAVDVRHDERAASSRHERGNAQAERMAAPRVHRARQLHVERLRSRGSRCSASTSTSATVSGLTTRGRVAVSPLVVASARSAPRRRVDDDSDDDDDARRPRCAPRVRPTPRSAANGDGVYADDSIAWR